MKEKIICAFDNPEVDQVLDLIEEVRDSIGFAKLGLEFFTANGPDGVKKIVDSGMPVFLDLKFHDIPNTVKSSVREAVKLGVSILTLHAQGGKEMLIAAREEAEETSRKYNIKKPMLFGVTVLTSIDQDILKQTGVDIDLNEYLLDLVDICNQAKIDGCVCSPKEIKIVRNKTEENFKILTPGIRPENVVLGDQKRVMTPKQAIEEGADYIVIGRPITKSDNPQKSAFEILRSLEK